MEITGAERLKNINEYYFSKKLGEVKSLINAGKPIINFGIGNPDLPPPENVLQALAKISSQQNNHGYQPYNGIKPLREAMSEFYQANFNVTLDPETQILPLAGSKEGIFYISQAYINPGDLVLIPDPGYIAYTTATVFSGGIPVYYDLTDKNNFKPDLENISGLLVKKIKMMWVNYPNMPTGATVDFSFYENLMKFAKNNNILIINDNAYGLIGTHSPLSILSTEIGEKHMLEINSLSKSFNIAGWRVGMIAGNKDLLERVFVIKSNTDSGMSYPIQYAASEALKNCKEWIQRLNEKYNIRRKLLIKMLERANLYPGCQYSGLFIWAKIKDNMTSTYASDFLLYEKNIFAVPGTVFGANGEGYLRFSICLSEEKIVEAIQRFKYED